jgi:hypothetical protein
VCGVVGVPLLVLSSLGALGAWFGCGVPVNVFAGASAVLLTLQLLMLHICVSHWCGWGCPLV